MTDEEVLCGHRWLDAAEWHTCTIETHDAKHQWHVCACHKRLEQGPKAIAERERTREAAHEMVKDLPPIPDENLERIAAIMRPALERDRDTLPDCTRSSGNHVTPPREA